MDGCSPNLTQEEVRAFGLPQPAAVLSWRRGSEFLPPTLRHGVIGVPIRRFQRHRYIAAGLDEQRHVGQCSTYDNQQLEPRIQQFQSFVNKRSRGAPAGLVTGRDDFEYGDDLIPAGVTDGNPAAFSCISLALGSGGETHLGRGSRQSDAAVAACSGCRSLIPLRLGPFVSGVFQCQNIRSESAGDLLG